MNLALIIIGILYLVGVVSGKAVAILSIIGGILWFLEALTRILEEKRKKSWQDFFDKKGDK